MFGVVLWSDTADSQAVIWCEDHGDLAFYRRPVNGDLVLLESGDLIQFDITREEQMRCAYNLRQIVKGMFPDIKSSLQNASSDVGQAPLDHVEMSAQILPFRRGLELEPQQESANDPVPNRRTVNLP